MKDDISNACAGSIALSAKSESDIEFAKVTEEVMRQQYENVEDELSDQEAWEQRMMAFMLGKGDYPTKEQREKEAKGENPCLGKRTTHTFATKWKW